jgi:hypothetical protein
MLRKITTLIKIPFEMIAAGTNATILGLRIDWNYMYYIGARRTKVQIFNGVLAALGNIIIISIILGATKSAKQFFNMPIDSESDDADRLKLSKYSPLRIVVFAPIWEEIFFRGFVLNCMKWLGMRVVFADETSQSSDQEDDSAVNAKLERLEKLINYGSVVGTALLFSVAHPAPRKTATFFSGLAYGALCEYSDGSVVPTIAAHATNNGLAYLKLHYR